MKNKHLKIVYLYSIYISDEDSSSEQIESGASGNLASKSNKKKRKKRRHR